MPVCNLDVFSLFKFTKWGEVPSRSFVFLSTVYYDGSISIAEAFLNIF